MRRTFIQVHDLAKALIELGQTDYRGGIHLGPTSVPNYFDFARDVCMVFGFEQHLVQPYTVSDEEIEAKAIRVDTTLDTRLAGSVLKTRFHTVAEGLLDAKKWSGLSLTSREKCYCSKPANSLSSLSCNFFCNG